jgi:hypothetical protein
MQFHEVANIFPMMTPEEFKGLVDDIRVSGQLDPIWIYQNKIIDGRNRYNACLELQIEPKTSEWDGNGDLVSFVVSKNLKRRQLTPSQLAMVAARIKHIFEAGAKERMTSGVNQYSPGAKRPEATGKSIELAAKAVGASETSSKRASRIIKRGNEELIVAVDTGKITVNKADEIARLPKEEQGRAIEEAKEPKKPVVLPEKPEEPKLSRQEVLKMNEEYIAANTVERTEDDIAIQEKMDEIGNYLRINIAELQNSICELATPETMHPTVNIFSQGNLRYHHEVWLLCYDRQ